MKNYTLIAVASLTILTLTHLVYALQRFGFSESVYMATGLLQILAYAGLTAFLSNYIKNKNRYERRI